jgi:integrase
MAKERTRLTENNARKAATPAAGRRYIFDEQSRYLTVCVTSNGSRTWYWCKKYRGTLRRYRIGPVNAVTLADARKTANRLTVDAENGIEPQAAKLARRAAGATLQEVFERFLDHKRFKGRKGKPLAEMTLSKYESQFRSYVPWKDRPLKNVTRTDVVDLHRTLAIPSAGHSRTTTANRVAALLSSLFNYAIDVEQFTGTNPVARIERYREKKKDRFLDKAEIGSLDAALALELNETFRDFFRLLLLAAQRRQNVMAMRWDEISTDNAGKEVWLIPQVKGGKPHAVPLTKRAMEIIEARRQSVDSEWVFPSQRSGERASKSGHIQEPKAAWKRVIAAAGLVDVTLHDLRRTLASHMAINGTSEAIIAKMLGHSSQSVTGIYARLNTEAVRDAMESAQDAMFSLP